MFTHILFDLDGTLTDPKLGITGCAQYALHELGIEEPDLDKLEVFIGPPLVDSFIEFYGMDRKTADRAVEKYRERFAVAGIYENELYPGMQEMLSDLKAAGCRLAVASSKPEPFVKRILEHFEIAEYFDEAVGSGLDGSLGQKEDVVREALRRLFGGSPSGDGDAFRETTVMVGDRKYDVTGARAAGLRCVGVSFGYAQPGELEEAGAWRIAQDVESLEKILLGTDRR
ncbi:MAG TPA: HAD hydrolase-like protein [Candidatus Eisenbergiella merdipullorum]|uniref:HAD hydrolase-like protein n=1 Tax=Candidatus Eisenbergiella merdipullorum TaxID=2838553 RepID=A0A9D2I7T4_9FIRM|nr:HAD hydrolase-like protein [Candidatus Eisenbergiella merdipullorum]